MCRDHDGGSLRRQFDSDMNARRIACWSLKMYTKSGTDKLCGFESMS